VKLKRKKVVVSCVSFDTVKIVDPIRWLENVKKVYLLHHVRKDVSGAEIYQDFYNEVTRQLKDDLGINDIIEVNVKIYRVNDVLRTLLTILPPEIDEENDVFINLSGGPSEYAAGATIASMMIEGIKSFTVGTGEYWVPENKIKEVFFDEDRPVGLTKSVREPKPLQPFKIAPPPEYLIKSLKIYQELIQNKKLTSKTELITKFKIGGCWERGQRKVNVRDIKQTERVHLSRHYFREWLNRGWVTRSKNGRFSITSSGDTIIEIFGQEDKYI
jgi:hypothetical protein